LDIDNLKRNKMRIENTKDYIKTGEFVCIKNDKNETLVRFYFADYKTDEDCIASAKQLLMFLEVAKATTNGLA
jgi:hypothetical protein